MSPKYKPSEPPRNDVDAGRIEQSQEGKLLDFGREKMTRAELREIVGVFAIFLQVYKRGVR